VKRRKGLAFFLCFFVTILIMDTMIHLSSAEVLRGDSRRVTETSKSIFQYDFPGLKKKISVDLRGMGLVEVLKFLAIKGDLNIMMGKGISGMVDLLIEDVAIGDILEILLSLNDLAYEVQGNVIQIIPNDVYKARAGVDFYDKRETLTYQLKYASAQKVATLLANVKSEVGKIVFDDGTGMLVLMDTPEKIREMKQIIQQADIKTINRVLPTETRVFELKYAKVEDIQDQVQEALTPEVGTLRTDTRTNSLVVTDLPHRVNEIATIIRAFDRKTREVFIEAKIVQVTLSDSYKWGVDWNKIFGVDDTAVSVTPDVTMPLSLSSYGKLTFSTTKSNLSAVLEMLSTVGETKILSNPHIAVEEGQEATINVVTKQPYSETTTTTTDSATTQSTEFTFVDVGVKLTVTPRINSDNYISMLISPEVSSITSFFPSEASDQRVPVVETSNAQTTVMVRDGTTIIIAGMIKDSKTKSLNKVPGIADVPVLGGLFRSQSDVIQRTETVVFLTPTIINGDDFFLLERDKPKQIKGIRK